MARPRHIDQNAILDAAEAVVLRDGAANLTLDAVAVMAGISKPSVIYDYKSKQALIKAVVDRRVALEVERTRAALDPPSPVSDLPVRGQIAFALEEASEDMRGVGIQLCSALAQDAELRRSYQALQHQRVEEILSTSENPRAAILAFLAVEGLKAMEIMGFLEWSAEGRAAILADVGRLLDQPSDALSGTPAPGILRPLAPSRPQQAAMDQSCMHEIAEEQKRD